MLKEWTPIGSPQKLQDITIGAEYAQGILWKERNILLCEI
jgi:hypothetical protein